MITYKGYTALLEVDVPSGVIVGHVIGVRDEIVFTGKTTEESVAGFQQAVDFYLGRLAEAGQEPERPFSGRFNVRIDPETHRRLVLDAEARRVSLNDVVKRAFAAYLEVVGMRDEDLQNDAAGPEQADLVATIGDKLMLIEAKRSKPKGKTAKVGAKRATSKPGS
jgi:predicted HicB family RNase H-like nuclease